MNLLMTFFLCCYLPGNSQEVKIGQLCPDMVISNVVNSPQKQIRLSDYRGKIVIFDFGTTGCGPCIKLLPHLDSLQRAYGDKVQFFFVTPEEEERANYMLAHNKKVKGITIPIVTRDTTLSQKFPHEAIPHEVWIDPTGVLIAHTEGDYITAENVSKVYRGEKVDFIMKHEEHYDYNQPLVILNEKNIPQVENEPVNSNLYYTSFTSYLDGVQPRHNEKVDSASQTYRVSIMNFDPFTMYMTAWNIFWTEFPRSHIVLETDHPDRIDEYAYKGYRAAFMQKYAHCYEAVLPLSMPEKERLKKIRQDLDTYLGMHGRIEEREEECWIIVKGKDPKQFFLKAKKREKDFDARLEKERKMVTLENVSWTLNFNGYYWLENPIKPTIFPPTIDETGFKRDEVKNYLLENIWDTPDFEHIKARLNYYGLNLIKEKRKIPMFIISDHP